jgi:VanZ family protein
MWYITRAYIIKAAQSWGLVLAVLSVMFVASAQPKPDVSPDAPLTIYFSGLMPIFPGWWEILIKKGGHVIAYGLLAVLTMRAGLMWDVTQRRAAMVGVVLAIGYAVLDEFHQSFVPGRHPSATDIGLDLIGAVLFVLAAWHAVRGTLPHPAA